MEINLKKIIALLLSSFVCAWISKPIEAAPLGDRLIMSVNGIPYSQLQVEGYLNIKESLRDDPAKSQLVTADNWSIALSSFIKDMALYQEANRTSGFRANRELVTKASERVQQTLQSNPRFKTRFVELGIDAPLIREYIARILAIENLRRSRNGLLTSKTSQKNQNQTDWENDLVKRVVIRWFEHGKTYENISLSPTP